MLPNLEDKVAVVGYPVGGENLSVTAGVVSRIDMQEYTMGDYDLLAVQVDAAINPGNSGGPVFDIDNEFIGIAFQALKDGTTENCGYIIPFPVVLHFLEDVRRNKKYTGFCSLNFSLQKVFMWEIEICFLKLNQFPSLALFIFSLKILQCGNISASKPVKEACLWEK